MVEDVLVSANIAGGEALVRALDAAGFPVLAAFWRYEPESDRWRLVLATPEAASPQEAYIRIGEIADAARIQTPDLAEVSLVPPTDLSVATLSRTMRIEGLSGVRLSKSMVDGVYFDDAYIYRTAA